MYKSINNLHNNENNIFLDDDGDDHDDDDKLNPGFFESPAPYQIILSKYIIMISNIFHWLSQSKRTNTDGEKQRNTWHRWWSQSKIEATSRQRPHKGRTNKGWNQVSGAAGYVARSDMWRSKNGVQKTLKSLIYMIIYVWYI